MDVFRLIRKPGMQALACVSAHGDGDAGGQIDKRMEGFRVPG